MKLMFFCSVGSYQPGIAKIKKLSLNPQRLGSKTGGVSDESMQLAKEDNKSVPPAQPKGH